MKNVLFSIIKRNHFVLLFITIFLILDFALIKWDPVNRYGFFYQNDFSKTYHLHSNNSWDTVFFGSSIITAAYNSDLSSLSIVNLGIDYGKATDLESLLKKGYLKKTNTIVFGLTYMTLMDNLPTNPYYQWHRKPYMPYVYFYRSPIRWFFENSYKAVKSGKSPFKVPFDAYQKELYHGNLNNEQLNQKMNNFEERFGNEKVENFQQNLNSLQKIIAFCKNNNINLKCLWMPINPLYELPKYAQDVKSKADYILAENKIETVDWTNKFPANCFFDLVHISWENGAPQFTKELEKWLKE